MKESDAGRLICSAIGIPAENEIKNEFLCLSKVNHSTMLRNGRNLLLVLLCVIGGYTLWRLSLPPAPELLARSKTPVTAAQWSDGAWYWLEGAGTPAARIARVVGPRNISIVAEGGIQSFALGQGRIAWISGAGSAWKIVAASTDGKQSVDVWHGDREPRGLCLADSRVWWAEQAPPTAPDCGALPPLDSTVHVISAPIEGGPPTIVGEIMEPDARQVIGVQSGQVYVSASRGRLLEATVIYRLPVSGGQAQRVAAELGDQRALSTHDGALYWTGQSREAAEPVNVASVHRLGRDGRPELLADWLPLGGRLFEFPGGVCYVDGSYTPAVWPIFGGGRIPVSAPQPPGYSALAIGNGEILVENASGSKDVMLYRTPLR